MEAHLLLQFGETVDPRPSPSTTSAFEFRDGARRTFCSCRGNNPVSLRFVAELNIVSFPKACCNCGRRSSRYHGGGDGEAGRRFFVAANMTSPFPTQRASPTIWTEGYPFQGCSPLIDIKATTTALAIIDYHTSALAHALERDTQG